MMDEMEYYDAGINDGKVYKTKEKFFEALADFSENVVPFRYGKIK